MADRKIRRRKFLKTLALSGCAAFAMPQIVRAKTLGLGGGVAPSNRICVGFIGVGGHGYGVNLMNFKKIKEVQIGTLCDVDLERLETARKRLLEEHKIEVDAKRCVQDFRNVISDPAIDAVVISTPDHWHAPLSVMALRAGKHVFSEKPTASLEEGALLEREVLKSGKSFMAGIEDRALPNYVRMLDLARNGRLGKLVSANVGIPIRYKQFAYVEKREEKIPPTFDYELWQGPAPAAPYQKERCHYNFRWQKMYGIGLLSDWGTHMFDIAQLAIDGDAPKPVRVAPLSKPKYLKGLYDIPYDFSLRFDYKNGARIFMDSGETSFRITGEKGWVESPAFNQKPTASSPEILHALLKPSDVRYRSEKLQEQQNFIDNIRCGRALYLDARALKDLCFPLHAADIAMTLERPLDIAGDGFADDAKANSMRARAYRKPFDILSDA